MEEIIKWLKDPRRDYAAGAALYARHGKNRLLARSLMRGTARFWQPKLEYELRKLLATMEARGAAASAPRPRPARNAARVETDEPVAILAAKKEIVSLYGIIGRMHRELYDIGTSNSSDAVKARKKILDRRIPIIERADRLYNLKEDWYAGDAAAADEIAALLAAPLERQPSLAVPPRAEVAAMNDINLSKRKTQLRSSITKTKNMLDFQSIRKGDTPTPMPDGPKRTEFEKKLKELKKEYAEVSAELNRRSQ